MNWRERVYESYVSTHSGYSGGFSTAEYVRSQFPIYKFYFGKFLPFEKNVRIMEVGCGNGALLFWLSSIGYTDLSGIDASREQIAESKKIGVKNIIEGDAKEILIKSPNSFDVIIARDVIEHFEPGDSLAFIEKMCLSLKPGGILILQTPNAESPLGSRHRYYDFTHGVAYTPSSIGQVLGVVGIKNFSIYPTRPAVHGPLSFIRYILWRAIEIFWSFYLLVETGSSKGVFTQNMIIVAKKEVKDGK